jgi:hypothetical protein
MGEVVRFVPKSDLERARLIREACAIYEHIPGSEGLTRASVLVVGWACLSLAGC